MVLARHDGEHSETSERMRGFPGRQAQQACDADASREHQHISAVRSLHQVERSLPIQSGSAETIAKILEERVFCYLGVPERIDTDQGAQFESRLMAELCALWGVRKSHTTPYHPQANRVVKRGNMGLDNMQGSMLISRDKEDWELLLQQIMRTIRASPHKLTGETANFMMLGERPGCQNTSYTDRQRTIPPLGRGMSPSWLTVWRQHMTN